MYHYNPQSGLSQNFEKNISIQICMEKFWICLSKQVSITVIYLTPLQKDHYGQLNASPVTRANNQDFNWKMSKMSKYEWNHLLNMQMCSQSWGFIEVHLMIFFKDFFSKPFFFISNKHAFSLTLKLSKSLSEYSKESINE